MNNDDHETRKIISLAISDFLLTILKSNVSEKTYSDCLLAISTTYEEVIYLKKSSQINTEQEVFEKAVDKLKNRYIWADDYRKQKKNV